ncbi:MAG: cytochrome c oxidase subunit II, partial [Phycisphaerales bacterium]|nr:cytochrome c oxidase subunit II [Phycisphaerales bacterium]
MLNPNIDTHDLRTSVLRRVWHAVLVTPALLLAACDTPQRDIEKPYSDVAEISAWFYHMLLIVVSIIMFIVAAWFLYSVVKFRRKPGDDTMPPQTHGHTQLEIIWTIIPTIIVIAITIPTIQGIFELEKPPAEGEEVVLINVTGKQWWWEYDYMDPADPSKIMFSTANEMHVEEGTTVHMEVTSADVIHAFWVPNLTGKRDATPGRRYPMYFKPNKVGEFIGQCAELCGASHALMGIKVFVHPKEGTDSYDNWVAAQLKPAELPTSPIEEEGKRLFIAKGCMRCHNVKGDARTELHHRARRWET